MALIATVGGASSNSFGTEEEADTYFEDRPQAADWRDLKGAKESWLVQATDRLSQLSYQGKRADPDQALPFPRIGVIVDGVRLASDEIPDAIKRAEFKLALLLSAEADPLADTGLEGFERLKVDVIEIVPRDTRPAGELPEDIRREIAPYLAGTSTLQFRVARG